MISFAKPRLFPWRVPALSIDWSGEFIKCCMKWANNERAVESKDRERINAMLPWVKVCANEIGGIDSSYGALGWLSKDSSKINQEGTSGILTSEDKLMVLERLADKVNTEEQRVEQQAPRGQPQCSRIIYVGDSATDFACLCSDSTDMGICIRDEPMGSGQRGLAEILDRVGVKVIPIDDYEGMKGESATAEKVLWWARDFDHLLNSPLMK